MLWLKRMHLVTVCAVVSLIQYASSASNVEKKCETCKDIVGNYKKGLKSTAGQNFGGGNTDWEESRLGSYANSETRLVEIVEGLCRSVSKESMCYGIVEEHEEDIEHWWFKKRKEQPDLHKYLCISLMKVCCPENTFGPDCKACPGGSTTCNDHGNCQGSGTRGGSGECDCHSGYQGDNCDDCQENYYEVNSTCEACHVSCDSSCSKGGPEGCDDCSTGWNKTEDGCVDINECDDSPCEVGTHCINSDGSHQCRACHEACDGGCSGAGINACLGCKSGYTFEEGLGCKDVNECTEGDKCDPGSFCFNTEGSYECKTCHDSCELECSGPDPVDCKSCKTGYNMVEGSGCQDIDECVVDKIVCDERQFCNNLPGRHTCEGCDRACSSCIASGPEGCTKCATGYERRDQRCQDINECKDDPCHSTESCVNLNGSHKCRCKDGYSRKDGMCTKDEEPSDDDDDDDSDDKDTSHEEL